MEACKRDDTRVYTGSEPPQVLDKSKIFTNMKI